MKTKTPMNPWLTWSEQQAVLSQRWAAWVHARMRFEIDHGDWSCENIDRIMVLQGRSRTDSWHARHMAQWREDRDDITGWTEAHPFQTWEELHDGQKRRR